MLKGIIKKARDYCMISPFRAVVKIMKSLEHKLFPLSSSLASVLSLSDNKTGGRVNEVHLKYTQIQKNSFEIHRPLLNWTNNAKQKPEAEREGEN